MTNMTEYENLKKIILEGKNISAEHLTAFHAVLPSVNAVKDLPSLLPVVFNYAFSKDISIHKASIPVLQSLADLLEVNVNAKNDDWWPGMKTTINNSINKISTMVSGGHAEWCLLWCTIVTLLGKDLRSCIKTINALLKVVEMAFKTSSEKERGFECWCKLIDNFALCPSDMNSKRRLSLLLIPLQAHNHFTKETCLSKLNTWKHLLSNLEATNETTINMVLPPFFQFMYEGVGTMPPACNFLPDKCSQIFKLLLNTENVFQALSQQFIKNCGTCVVSCRSVDPDLCVHVWLSMLNGMKKLSWPEDRVADIILQLKFLHKEIGTTVLFTDILEATYNVGLPASLLCKHYNSFISMTISPHVVCNIKENVLKSVMDIMDHMSTFLLSDSTFQLINNRLYALFDTGIKEEMKNELENNVRIIWSSLSDAMYKWIANGGSSNEERIKQDMKLVHSVLMFGITRLESQWNKSVMRSWKLLFSESLKYFLLQLLVNSEQFVIDLTEKIVKGIKDQLVSLLIAVEVSSILLEYSQSKETDSLTHLLMEIGEKILSLLPMDMPKGLSLLNQFLKALVVAVRTRPLLAASCISVTENLSQVKMDLPVTENQKISAKIMKTQMQLVSLKSMKTVEKLDSPVPSSSPTVTSFLHRLAKAEGNKTRSRVCSPQSLPQETKPVSQSSPKLPSQMFMDSGSQDDYVFVPPKKTVIPLTEHQKERMAARRSDIPALYQDLSQDSQSVNLESISFSHADCKSPVKNSSPSKSPVKHFSGIQFQQASPEKNIVFKSPSKSLENGELLKSSNKQNNSPKKNDSDSLSECVDDSNKIKLFNVAKTFEKNVSQEPRTSQKINKSPTDSPLKTANSPTNSPLKTAVIGNNLQNKTLDSTELSSKINEEDLSVLSGENKMNNSLSKNSFYFKSNSENLKISGKNTPVTTDIVSNESVKVGAKTPEKDARKTEESGVTKKLEPSSKKKQYSDKKVSSVGVKTRSKKQLKVSIKKTYNSRNTSNANNDVNKEYKKQLFEVNCKDIHIEPPAEKEENECNQISPLKVKNEEFNSNTISVDSASENTNNNEQMINRVVKEEPSELEDSKNNETGLTPYLEKNKELENKVSPLKVINENKKVNRKSLPSKVSPIKTRRSSQRLLECDVIITRQKKSLDQSKSFDNKLQNHHKKPKPKLSKTENKKNIPKVGQTHKGLTQFDTNKTYNVKRNYKRKLNVSTENNNLNKRTKLSKDLNKNVEEINGVLPMVKPESPIHIYNKNTLFTKNNNNSGTPEEEYDEHISSGDEIKIKEENTDCDQYKSEQIMEVVTAIDLGSHMNNSETISSANNNNLLLENNKMVTIDSDVINSQIEQDNNLSVGSIEKTAVNINKPCEGTVEDLKNNKDLSDLDHETSLAKCNNQALRDISEKSLSKICEFSSPVKNDVKESQVSCNNDKEPVICITNLSNICLTPIKKRQETENSTVNKKHIIVSRTQVEILINNHNRCIANGPKTISQKEMEVLEVSLSKEDIEMLDKKDCCNILKIEDAVEIINDPVPEKTVLDLNSSDKLNTPFSVENSDKLKTTPEKPSKKQIEYLKQSPIIDKILNKLDCTPPKENTEDQLNSFTDSNSKQNMFASNKIKKKKLTSPVLSDWVLRTPIKKSPETSAKDNNTETDLVTMHPGSQHESEDLIPSSQEAVGTSTMTFIKISDLFDLKTSSPGKRITNPQLKKSSACNQNDLLEVGVKINTDLSASPKKSSTPVKKSVCRRLVVDSDKETERELEFDKENSCVSNPREIEKLDIPILTSDKECNGCKELIVQCSEECGDGNEKLIVRASIVDTEEETITEQVQTDEQMSKPSVLRKSINRVLPQSPKKSSECDVVVISSPKSPRRRTSQLMALAFKKDDSGDGLVTPTNGKLKRNQLFRPSENGALENQQSEPNHFAEKWVCRSYSPSASPNTGILKRKVNIDDIPEPSSPVNRDKRKRVSFLDPVVTESLVFSKSEFGKGQIMRAERKQIELDTQSQGSVSDEVELGNSQVPLFPALETCKHPISNILERDVTRQWMPEMEASLQILGVTTVGQLCKLSEATIERLPFPPPKVKRLHSLLQEYLDDNLNSPRKKLKVSSTKDQLEQVSTSSASSEESLTDIAARFSSYFQTYPQLVETLGKTLQIDTIMSMLNVAVATLKSKQNS